LQRLEDQLTTLIEASQVLLTSDTLNETLAHLLRFSETLVEADAYAIWGHDTAADRAEILASRGLSPAYINDSETNPRPASPLQEVAISDVSTEPSVERYRPLYEAEGIRALLVIPLAIATRRLGGLAFYYRAPHQFPENERQFARSFANLAATAIAAAESSEAEEEAQGRLSEILLEQQRAEASLRLLVRAGILLEESLDYNVTLANLVRAVVPGVADWCALHLLEEGEVRQVALAHPDPARVAWAEALRERFRQDNSDARIREVIDTGRTDWMPLIPPELLAAAARDEEQSRIIDEMGFTSYIMVPVRSADEVIGALTLVTAESGRRYDENDVSVAEEIGRRAGLAVERARLYRASEEGREALLRSNKAKDDFLGIVSHELRSPLTVVLGSARLLQDRGHLIGDEDRADLLNSITSEAAKMTRLVENLLLLARLELGQPVVKSPVDLQEVVERVLDTVRDHRDVVLTDNFHSEYVLAEPTFLEEILMNLVGNADKYSPDGEAFEVLLERRGGGISFHILDTGPGVDEVELPRIFDSFYRSARTAQLPGKGLGLAICKRLVEVQGGEIWAKARPGGGLEVGFTLPGPGETAAVRDRDEETTAKATA